MKRTLSAIGVCASLMVGCATPDGPAPRQPAAGAAVTGVAQAVYYERAHRAGEVAPVYAAAQGQASADPAIARLPGLVISREQVLSPLIEAHGLSILLNVVQLELARQNAQRKGLTVSPDDLQRERERTLEQAFFEADNKTNEQIEAAVAKGDNAAADRLRQELKRDRERALDQLLTQQRVSRPEFEMVLQTNAYLRKIAEQNWKEVPDETLRKAFETEYGATVRVRHIQAANLKEIAQAQARLKAGEPFDKVAREVSRNKRTAAVGGELPKFSLATPNVPDNFKQIAFGLGEGQVSDPVFLDGSYHLIKLEQKLAPRAVKFEDVKETLRAKVREQFIQNQSVIFRDQLAEQARTTLQIEDPVLRQQFAKRLEDRDRQIKEMKTIEERQAQERRQRPAGAPAAPGAAPAVNPESVLPVPQGQPSPR